MASWPFAFFAPAYQAPSSRGQEKGISMRGQPEKPKSKPAKQALLTHPGNAILCRGAGNFGPGISEKGCTSTQLVSRESRSHGSGGLEGTSCAKAWLRVAAGRTCWKTCPTRAAHPGAQQQSMMVLRACAGRWAGGLPGGCFGDCLFVAVNQPARSNMLRKQLLEASLRSIPWHLCPIDTQKCHAKASVSLTCC